jgi:hypothetical protein
MAQVAKIEAFVFSLCEHRGKQRYLKCIHHELIYRHQHMDTILRLIFMPYSSPETV